MFKYQVRGIVNDRKPMIIALTHFADVAQYIADHAAEARGHGEKGRNAPKKPRLAPEGDEAHEARGAELDQRVGHPGAARQEHRHRVRPAEDRRREIAQPLKAQGAKARRHKAQEIIGKHAQQEEGVGVDHIHGSILAPPPRVFCHTAQGEHRVKCAFSVRAGNL